jgi:peptide/nickel transport system substrate-binding protein
MPLRTVIAALFAGLATILPASGQVVAPDRVLRIVPNADLQSLDPVASTAGVVQSHGQLVYDQLFGRDADQRPQPQMVEAWSVSDDALAWTFTLREGLRFHDGAPVTATDVVASLRRWGARDPHGRQILAITEAMEVAADGRSFAWRLRRPYGLLLVALSKPAGNMPAIMPARVAATDPATAVTEAIGSGPFVFVRDEWMPGSRAVYRRNPDYVPRGEPASGTAGGKVAHVDRVELLTIRDAQTAALALANGEVEPWRRFPAHAPPARHADRPDEHARRAGHDPHEPPAPALRRSARAPGAHAARRPAGDPAGDVHGSVALPDLPCLLRLRLAAGELRRRPAGPRDAGGARAGTRIAPRERL